MAAGSQSFLGQVCIMGYNALPTGYASCQGQLLSIASNTALFSILGTIYGGNGVTTFALPDMQGRVVVGAGNTYTLGQTGGSATNTLTIANLPSHTHNAPFPSLNVLAGGAANTISPVNNYPAVVSDKLYGPNFSVSAVQLIGQQCWRRRVHLFKSSGLPGTEFHHRTDRNFSCP
jgi:microcystin-dependent protein